MVFPHQITSLQQIDLEADVSFEEVKRAVWDCGIDKSPGPDGFTFDFFRRFWDLVRADVVKAVSHFFISGIFLKGCHASFIALIPKISDAKMVKDFRPISLIGSLYKIIAKILANRLVVVLNDIVNEVQSAFVADRLILDGPFILNESNRNIDTLMYMLKCFHRASGLSINLNKCKLMGISVSDDKVEEAAVRLGCGVLNTPFNYLGSKVGGCMSRTQSWNEVVDKMVNRLSGWKMKTLSIGGRLTLLKAVLGSMPIYNMSIFKVPMHILQGMESLRSHFFNGIDLNSKKSIWVRWNNVLASKENGGLGVSSLFSLNRTLLFKWVWRFFTQKETLWARVISAIHGVDGGFGSAKKSEQAYIWCNITKEMERLASQDIDLFNFMQKKIGNGLNTFFWNDSWRGDTKLKDDFPRLYALEHDKSITVAANRGVKKVDPT
nr:RNA-directed DNA polymerase, eukaryota, reverse transcriptase zinc-binding domain protein [Tanacetum cinerariifolium]